MSLSSGFAGFCWRFVAVPVAVMVFLVPVHAEPMKASAMFAPLPVVGSRDVMSIEPQITRPDTPHCTVELFPDHEFDGSAVRQAVDYIPPVGCSGPWSRVVLEADFSVSAGQQFDRTVRVRLGGVNILTGTTVEPARKQGATWHVERDLTDYSALLRQPEKGDAELLNIVTDQNNGRIKGAARLVFYKAAPGAQAPDVPDNILPLDKDPAFLTAASPRLKGEVFLPRNVTRLMLDVLAMPQQVDEFWYMCMPIHYSPEMNAAQDRTCGIPFRETEVRVDGILAGIAPVFPWIYTGGFNAMLWKQIPGIETLNLHPYRVDLTPFAGRLNDGRPHHIDLSVVGARRYVVMTGTLLAWRDPGRQVVNGELVRSSGKTAAITVHQDIPVQKNGTGKYTTRADQIVEAVGYVETSHGRVETSVSQKMSFENAYERTDAGSSIVQINRLTTRHDQQDLHGHHGYTVAERFPLTVRQGKSGAGTEPAYTLNVQQGLIREMAGTWPENITPQMRLFIAATAVTGAGRNGALTEHRSNTSEAWLQMGDGRSRCHERAVKSLNDVIVSVKDSAECREIPQREP